MSASALISVVRIYRLDGARVDQGTVAYQTRGYIQSLTVSPNAQAMAIVEASQSERLLIVASLPPLPAQSRVVASAVADRVAWCPDKRSFVFIKEHTSKTKESTGSLNVATVLDSNGKLCKEMKTSKLISLPGFSISSRIHCTENGVIFVSSSESVPGLETGPQKLFKVSLDKPSTITRIVPDQFNIQESCDQFRVAPDGRNIAVLKSDGTVDVLDIVNGGITQAQSKSFSDSQSESVILPNWRSNDQLCFCEPIDNNTKRAVGVMLWSLSNKQEVDISSRWSEEAASFLQRAEP